MKYTVTYAITGRLDVEVNCDTPEEAKKIATEKYYETDFGELKDIDGFLNNVQDEEGKEYI